MDIILIGAAAWIVWEAIRAAWPWQIWPVCQLIIVAAACYGLTYADHRIIAALAAAAVVAAIRQVVQYIGNEHSIPVRPRSRSVTSRVPDLP